MEKLMYMMMIEKSKTYNRITKQVVMEHVENMPVSPLSASESSSRNGT